MPVMQSEDFEYLNDFSLLVLLFVGVLFAVFSDLGFKGCVYYVLFFFVRLCRLQIRLG